MGSQAQHAESTPPQSLNENLCWLLSRASYTLTTELTAAMEDLGVSPRGQSVLATAMCGAYTQTELAKMVGLDKTTMVVTLDELEKSGLAERRPSPADRRARVIAVTAAGRRSARPRRSRTGSAPMCSACCHPRTARFSSSRSPSS